MPPFWRKVRYTDDGCSIFQCLECKGQWESRTEPGWYEFSEEVDGPGEGVRSIQSRSGDEKEFRTVYYRDRKEPIYHPYFNFCPLCGVALQGAIVVGQYNERMLGERRQKIEDAMHERDMAAIHSGDDSHRYPRWWWVIQERTVSVRDGEVAVIEDWRDYLRGDPRRISAHLMFEELQDKRAEIAGRNDDKLFPEIQDEVRLIQKQQSEYGNRYVHVNEVYPRETRPKPIGVFQISGEDDSGGSLTD